MNILLADDDLNLSEILSKLLKQDGHEVTTVSNGGRMLVTIGRAYSNSDTPKKDFDLIITDYCMPVCNGLQIVEGLRRAAWATPVILITAYDDQNIVSKAKKLNVDVIKKPFCYEDINNMISKISEK